MEERRLENFKVEQERRVAERIAVLETKVDAHGELLTEFVNKLDEHIMIETENDVNLKNSIGQLTQELTQTNSSLKVITESVLDSKLKLIRIDAIWLTLTKMAFAASIVIGALWALFVYVDKHIVHAEALVEIPIVSMQK